MPLGAFNKHAISIVLRGVEQQRGNYFSENVSTLMASGVREEVAIKFVMGELIALAHVSDFTLGTKIPPIAAEIWKETFRELRQIIYRDDIVSYLRIPQNNEGEAANRDDVWHYVRTLINEDLGEFEDLLLKAQASEEKPAKPYSSDEIALLEFVQFNLRKIKSKWTQDGKKESFLDYYESAFLAKDKVLEFPNILKAARQIGCKLDSSEVFFSAIEEIYRSGDSQYQRQVVKSLLMRILAHETRAIDRSTFPQEYHKLIDEYNNNIVSEVGSSLSKPLVSKIGVFVNSFKNFEDIPTKYDAQMEEVLDRISVPVELISPDFVARNRDVLRFFINHKTEINHQYFSRLLIAENFDFAQEIIDKVQDYKEVSLKDSVRFVAERGGAAAMNFLVRNGVDIHSCCEHQFRAFHIAALSGNVEILEYFVGSADFDRSILSTEPNPLQLVLDAKLGNKSKSAAEFLITLPEVKDSELAQSLLKVKAESMNINHELIKKKGWEVAENNRYLAVARTGGCRVRPTLQKETNELEQEILRMNNERFKYDALFEKAVPRAISASDAARVHDQQEVKVGDAEKREADRIMRNTPPSAGHCNVM